MFVKALKTLTYAVFSLALAWASPSHAAGTIPLAMAQQVDVNGAPLANCQVYFFIAGTVASPQNSYSDFGLTIQNPPFLTCDQAGRVPMFWLADGLVHVRLIDQFGTPIIDTTMQVLGPSSGGGGGGGGTVDPTTILSTGDEKIRYGIGAIAGFVRENGLTIGNASSGASERANADTQALFIYLYNTDANLVVSGGRTGNALNDYNANKTIALPDMRGMVNAFLDDMGNSPAGRLTSTYLGCAATTLGCGGGLQTSTLAPANLPPYTPVGTVTHTVNGSPGADALFPSPVTVTLSNTSLNVGIFPPSQYFSLISTFTGTPAPGQVDAPFGILPPMRLKTAYIKL